MDTGKTMVMFRVTGTAFIPELRGIPVALLVAGMTRDGWVQCRFAGSARIGVYQPYKGVLANSRPASPEEAMDLASKLKEIGYKLAVRNRPPTPAYREKWLAAGNN